MEICTFRSNTILILGRFCGNGRIDELIISVGSRMLITHVTSEKGTSSGSIRGFAAIYESKRVKLLSVAHLWSRLINLLPNGMGTTPKVKHHL